MRRRWSCSAFLEQLTPYRSYISSFNRLFIAIRSPISSRSLRMNSEYIVSLDDRILVTGSNGFIGTKVVEILLDYGFSKLRCFVRCSSQLGRLEQALSYIDAGRN